MANNNPLSQVTTLLGGGSGGSALSGTAGTGGSGALTQQLTTITQQLQQLQTVNQTQMETLEANTAALSQNTSAKGASGSSTASTIGSTLESVFGLGLSPLISGLVSLFGGGGSSQPTPLVPYVAPASVQANAGISSASSGAFAVDTADGGLPRPVPASGSGSSSSSSSTTQITVQVQALDSQSFLDHSDDIAAAVRQAMLTSTTLNDVIRAV
jgi:hypothetical protein